MRKNKKDIIEPVIYKIEHISSGRIYIGSALNFYKRIWVHKYHLNSNTHYNSYLQRVWNKYGKDDFKFEVIEKLINSENLVEREQHWLDYFKVGNKEKCFNILPTAYSNLGHSHSENTKLKMRNKKLGTKWTQKQKELMSSNKKGKKLPNNTGNKNKLSKAIIQYDLMKNKIKSWESISQCSLHTKIHKSNIIMCLKGKIKQIHGYIFEYVD